MISVIVPVYKVEEFLPACLDSLLSQTVTDWECILVDDGSPDKSGAICDAYVARDGRFIAIHQPNGGVSAARNAGLDNAGGEFVAFLDADDRLAPDFLERLAALMETGVDLAVCEYRRILPDGQPYVDGEDDHIGEYLIDADIADGGEQTPAGLRLAVSDAALAELWNTGVLNSVWGKLYRRSLIEEAGLRFDTDLHFAEDMRFAAGYAARSAMFGVLEKPLYLYLWREGSLTTAPKPGMLRNRYRALTAVAEGFAEAGCLKAAAAVRDRLDFLTPEPFLERMEDKADRLALLQEYCGLENYPRMLATIRQTRSRLTYLAYKTRSPRILHFLLGAMLRRRGREGGAV
ncbi:MAG: glycosyltransferase [Clostridia bacterium]|nr:glycosyltransferase [Clostridia bacterium]